MQISRHWRLNAQRYRLEGVRYQNGDVSLSGSIRLSPEIAAAVFRFQAGDQEVRSRHCEKEAVT